MTESGKGYIVETHPRGRHLKGRKVHTKTLILGASSHKLLDGASSMGPERRRGESLGLLLREPLGQIPKEKQRYLSHGQIALQNRGRELGTAALLPPPCSGPAAQHPGQFSLHLTVSMSGSALRKPEINPPVMQRYSGPVVTSLEEERRSL